MHLLLVFFSDSLDWLQILSFLKLNIMQISPQLSFVYAKINVEYFFHESPSLDTVHWDLPDDVPDAYSENDLGVVEGFLALVLRLKELFLGVDVLPHHALKPLI